MLRNLYLKLLFMVIFIRKKMDLRNNILFSIAQSPLNRNYSIHTARIEFSISCLRKPMSITYVTLC